MPTEKRPLIAVTMGDPAGVGPEICLRLLADTEIANLCRPIVFGDATVLKQVAQVCQLPFHAPVIPEGEWPVRRSQLDRPAILDLQPVDLHSLRPGIVLAEAGAAAFVYINRAITAALANEVDAVTTAPINKESLHKAGVPFPGHTEMFTMLTKAKRTCMVLTSEEITCSLVTAHIGLRDVPRELSVARIVDTIELTVDAMRRMRNREPRLVACGLNPHAGEGGLFGDREEERFIIPALQIARATGVAIDGPIPPDTAFLPQRRKQTDAYICMYHDQGLIPLKMLAFDTAINITLGLPIIRTSVDHGTAFDIAWQGKASVTSLCEAVKLAARLALKRGD
jgi:4-hydroxythreonine-4-phosphate dehydrogenase